MKTIRFLYSSRFAGLILLTWLLGLACNLPVSSEVTAIAPETELLPTLLEPTGTLLVEEMVLPFLEVTVPARDANKIVLKSVEPDLNGNINKVVFWFPEQLLGAEIVINDQPQTYMPANPVELNIQGAALAPEANIVILSQGQQAVVCYIQMANPLYPSGDCSW